MRVVRDVDCVVDRDGEAEALDAGVLILCAHNADHLSAAVVDGTAGGCRVYRGVDLNMLTVLVSPVDWSTVLISRSSALTMPPVIVYVSSPSGLPTAYICSPTWRSPLLPILTGVRPVASILRTAMSLPSSSKPMISAVYVSPL